MRPEAPFICLTSVLALLTFGVINPPYARAAPACENFNDVRGSTQVQSIAMGDACLIMITPNDPGDQYRSYSFSSTGDFMIFNTFGNGPNSQDTGARTYFIFPRNELPRITSLSDSVIEATLASGATVRISAATTRLQSITGIDFVEDPRISRTNHGGVEITGQNTLILDCGFRLGDAAYGDRTRSSTFRDSRGNSCTLKNTDIFSYTSEARLKFTTDESLRAFLSTRCPALEW